MANRARHALSSPINPMVANQSSLAYLVGHLKFHARPSGGVSLLLLLLTGGLYADRAAGELYADQAAGEL